MAIWRGKFGHGVDVVTTVTADDQSEISDGSFRYVGQKGGNDTVPTYQDATGAPVERESPLGYGVGAGTIILLNISMMIGTGIYSTRKAPEKKLGC
jgi:hypothetical protein